MTDKKPGDVTGFLCQSLLPRRCRCRVVFFRGRSKQFCAYLNIDIASATGIGAVSAKHIGGKPELLDRVPAHLQRRKVDRPIHRPPLAFPDKAGTSSFVPADRQMEPARNICIRKIALGVTSAPRTFQIALLIGRIEPYTNWKRHCLGFMSVVYVGFIMQSSHVLQAHRALAVLCRRRRDEDYCNYTCAYGSHTCFHRGPLS